MSIENKISDTDFNIKEFNPELLKPIGFDPRRDVTPGQWAEIKKFLVDWGHFSWPLSDVMYFLSDSNPQMFKELEEMLWNKLVEGFDEDLAQAIRTPERFTFPFADAVALKRMNPKKFAGLNIVDQFQPLLEKLPEIFPKSNTNVDAKGLVDVNFIFPGLMPIQAQERLARIRADISHAQSSSNWYNLAEELANLRIGYPDEFAKVEINKETWENMKADLKQKLKPDPDVGLGLVMLENMTLLTAKVVKIGENGIEITLNESGNVERQTHPIPNIKSF